METQKLLTLARSDKGNAEALYLLYGKDIRYCTAKDKWLIWQDDHWREDDGAYVRNLLRQSGRHRMALFKDSGLSDEIRASLFTWLAGCENERRVGPAYKAAMDMRELQVREEDLDASVWGLGLRGSEFDLGEMRVKKPNPLSYITRRMATIYDSAADCPRWKQFLAEIFQGDERLMEFVQVAAGYCLTGSIKEQVMFVCVGEGANGKSTFLGTLYKLFGDYAGSTPFSTFDAKSRSEATNDLARLKGKRFVTIMETDEDSYLAEQKVKQATGEDPITCRFHYKEFFEYIPQFKIWMATNRIPSIKGVDYGIRRRLIIIPFEARFDATQRDPNLSRTLSGELPGILNWVLEGAQKWKEKGLHPFLPKRSVDVAEEYTEEVDHLGNWIAESLEVGEGDLGKEERKERAIDLYTSYKNWMLARSHRPKSITRWGQDMRSKGFDNKRKEQPGVVYIGVRLRPEALMGN